MKRGRKAIEVTQEMQEEAQRLASLGLNEKQISESLGMSYSCFQDKRTLFCESLKKGKLELRERITNAMLEKIDTGDTTALIFTCKRLGVFQPSMEATKPTNAQEALQAISKAYEALSNGEIQESQALAIKGLLEGFIKGYEVTELEKRLSEIEKIIKGEK